MKLLLINPNTTPAMTDLMLAHARRVVTPGCEIAAVTGRFGARYVTSRTSYAVAGHAALDAYAAHGRGTDAVVLACFGDPALLALKEIASQPVVGMAEAACLSAAARGGRFAIVTGGERWGPMLREFVTLIGLGERLAAVRTVAPTGAEIARDPDRALGLLAETCRACVDQNGADSVILGGAGLTGIAPRIADRVAVPLIDGLTAAVRTAEALASAAPGKATQGSFAPTPTVETIGLSPELGSLMAGNS